MENFIKEVLINVSPTSKLFIGGFWFGGGGLLYTLGVIIRLWTTGIKSEVANVKSDTKSISSELQEHRTADQLHWERFEKDCRDRHEYKGVNRRTN